MKKTAMLLFSALFAMTYYMLMEAIKGTSFEDKPMIMLLIIGVYGAFCLGFGYRFGQRSFLTYIKKNEEENTKDEV